MIHVTKYIINFTISQNNHVLSFTEFKYVLFVAKSIHGYKNEIVEKGNRYILRV